MMIWNGEKMIWKDCKKLTGLSGPAQFWGWELFCVSMAFWDDVFSSWMDLLRCYTCMFLLLL